VNRLTISELMTPAGNPLGRRHRQDFFMLTYLWVAIGGAIGSVGRYWLSGFVADRFGPAFPWGTIIVNITGCFVIGFFNTFTGTEGRWLVSPVARTFFMVGICGGYTTFSAFSLQTLNLANDGEWLYAAANILFSVVLCLLGVWLGFLLASYFNQMK
jgi:CrcB protein